MLLVHTLRHLPGKAHTVENEHVTTDPRHFQQKLVNLID